MTALAYRRTLGYATHRRECDSLKLRGGIRHSGEVVMRWNALHVQKLLYDSVTCFFHFCPAVLRLDIA